MLNSTTSVGIEIYITRTLVGREIISGTGQESRITNHERWRLHSFLLFFPFPHPLLTPIEGKPTALTVTHLRKEIYANTRSVHCTSGGGAKGFLGIVMAAAPYVDQWWW